MIELYLVSKFISLAPRCSRDPQNFKYVPRSMRQVSTRTRTSEVPKFRYYFFTDLVLNLLTSMFLNLDLPISQDVSIYL
eukprot:SAG31_NODE_3575_length_4110_cov_2.432560_2_plen_79_part_00